MLDTTKARSNEQSSTPSKAEQTQTFGEADGVNVPPVALVRNEVQSVVFRAPLALTHGFIVACDLNRLACVHNIQAYEHQQ